MSVTVKGCPGDAAELAERYWMRRLPASDARRFEDHVAGCPDCAEKLYQTKAFIEAIKIAGRRFLEP